MIENDKPDPNIDGLKKVLLKHPHLVKIFYQFLKNQFHIMHAKNALNLVADIFYGLTDPIDTNIKPVNSPPPQASEGHVWKNQKKKS